jgi:uncharacterized protein (TIGR03435 family)
MRLSIALMLAVTALSAQTFESISIRPYVPLEDDDAAPAREPGSMVYSNVSLKLLLDAAYGVRPDQIEGPAWLDTERYDVIAKPPAGATKDQVPAMLQHLLADRFGMVARVETRQRRSYALLVGKDGPKLTGTKAITGVDFRVAPDHIDLTGASLPAFASQLASFMGRPVADETHIVGSYDFRLNLTLAELKAASPAVFTAIQSLGLSLDPRTTTAKYVVVEKAEKVPNGN